MRVYECTTHTKFCVSVSRLQDFNNRANARGLARAPGVLLPADRCMEPRRWQRCGSASSAPHVTVESLRRGLERAENPSGVLRGRTVRPPRQFTAAARPPTNPAASSVNITGTQLELLQAPVAPAQPPLVLAHNHEERLPARRAYAVIKFRGGEGDGADAQAPAEWCCAICLRVEWNKQRLSRMPRCKHVFHTTCVDRWFQRASSCPYCRKPV